MLLHIRVLRGFNKYSILNTRYTFASVFCFLVEIKQYLQPPDAFDSKYTKKCICGRRSPRTRLGRGGRWGTYSAPRTPGFKGAFCGEGKAKPKTKGERERQWKEKQGNVLEKTSPRNKVLITGLQKLLTVIGEGLKKRTVCTLWTIQITACCSFCVYYCTCRRHEAGWQWTELQGKTRDQLQWILGHRVRRWFRQSRCRGGLLHARLRVSPCKSLFSFFTNQQHCSKAHFWALAHLL